METKHVILGGKKRLVYKAECQCGAVRWLQKSDLDSRYCIICQRRERASKGWLAMLHAQNYHDALENLSRQFANSLNEPERRVAELFNLAGLQFRCQVPVFYFDESERREKGFIVDFEVMVNGEPAFVEVNGRYWHDKPERAERDQKLCYILQQQFQKQPIFVMSDEIELVVKYLQGAIS